MPTEWTNTKGTGGGQAEGKNHQITLQHREQCLVTGVVEMISFDEKTVVADTCMGTLSIRGENLHVKRVSLETGELEVEGMVHQMAYQGIQERGKKGENFIKRLVR